MVVEVLESWHRSVGKETHDEFLEFPAFTGDGEIVDLVDGLEQGAEPLRGTIVTNDPCEVDLRTVRSRFDE